MRQLKREGFSLVELIIVIAIMAILSGGALLSYNLVRSADTKGTAYDIDSELTTLRSETMAKAGTTYMHLYRYNDEYYIDVTSSESFSAWGEGTKIGDSRVTVTIVYSEWYKVTLSNWSVFTIRYQKKDGAFYSSGDFPIEIDVTSDGATGYAVYMIKNTGKHYVESL